MGRKILAAGATLRRTSNALAGLVLGLGLWLLAAPSPISGARQAAGRRPEPPASAP